MLRQAEGRRTVIGNAAWEIRRRDQRHKESRYLVDRPGVLKNPVEGLIAIRVLEVSASGLRVSLPCRLKPFTQVEVEFEGAILKGIVRHCQCVGAAAFTAGVRLSEWDPEHPGTVSPEYLKVLRSGVELL
jgi:hypothetical protein